MELSQNQSKNSDSKKEIKTINGKLIGYDEMGMEEIKSKLNNLTQNTQKSLNANQSSLKRIETLYQNVLVTMILSILGIAIILTGMSFSRSECSSSLPINSKATTLKVQNTEIK